MAQCSPKSGSRKKKNKRENPSSSQILPEHQSSHPSRRSDFKPWMETRQHLHSILASQPPCRPKRPLNLALASQYGKEQPPNPPAHNSQPHTATTPRRDNPFLHAVSSEMPSARVRILYRTESEPDDDNHHLPHQHYRTTPRRANPYPHAVPPEMLPARARTLYRTKSEPDDDDHHLPHQHHHIPHQHHHPHHHHHLLHQHHHLPYQHHQHHHNSAKVQDQDKENTCDEQMRCRIETWLDGIEEFVPLKGTAPRKLRSWLKMKGKKSQFLLGE